MDGHPADVVKIVGASADWLSKSDVPKLFFNVQPGAILANEEDLAFIRSFPALTEVKVAGRQRPVPFKLLTGPEDALGGAG